LPRSVNKEKIMKVGDGCEQRHHQRAQDDCLPRSKNKRRLC
jgi:hypothetical protein